MTAAAGAGQVRELLARASSRENIYPGDARAGAAFERTAAGAIFLRQAAQPVL